MTRRTSVAAAAALVAMSCSTAWSVAPASARDGDTAFTCPTTTDSEVVQSPQASLPRKYLGLDQADEILARRGITPGQGVKVAVLDSGVVSRGDYSSIDIAQSQSFSPGAIEDTHGTVLAGLIAAKPQASDHGPLPVGIAPAAQIVDLKVYGETPEDSTHGGIDPSRVAAALRWLVVHAESDKIRIAVMAMNLPPNPEVKAAVEALAKKNIALLAATGNRVQAGSDGGSDRMDVYSTPQPGEDVANIVFPAGYTKQVLGVTATADGVPHEAGDVFDASGQVLFSSAIDLAMPVVGSTTLAINGSTCVLQTVETSWAVAEAAGVLALLMSAYPNESAAAVEARMLRTADGRVAEIGQNRLYGAGVPQPVDALTRVLHPKQDGSMAAPEFRPRDYPAAQAPPRAPDPLGNIVDHGLWWAILGGAALVITALLRPLLARRRTT